MPDLYFVPDERHLLAKWDYLLAVFRIVARDYKRVLGEEIRHDRHNTILKQTVSDLLDVEADLFRVGKGSPVAEFGPWMMEAWAAAVAWVREFRTAIPLDAMPVDDIEELLERRKRTENCFNVAVARMPDVLFPDDQPADNPTVLVHAA